MIIVEAVEVANLVELFVALVVVVMHSMGGNWSADGDETKRRSQCALLTCSFGSD